MNMKRMMTKRAAAALLLACVFTANVSAAGEELREYVCQIQAAGQLGSYNGGSGFVYVDAEGRNYVITNQHVIENTNTLYIVFRKQNPAAGGTYAETVYDDARLLYEDAGCDLAILSFPMEQRIFDHGFRLNVSPLRADDEVFAAGYPHVNWKFTSGPVLEPASRDERFFIRHKAKVDFGNSGGPLLVRGENGYSVVGVNARKDYDDRSFYSIPTDRVTEVLEKVIAEEFSGRWITENDAAAAVTSGEKIGASFGSAGDRDRYRIDVPQGGGELSVGTRCRAGVELAVYDSGGKELLSRRGADPSASLSVNGGAVFIEVKEAAAGIADSHYWETYTLTARLAPPDPYEAAESRTRPAAVKPADAWIARAFGSPADVDWFSLTVPPHSVLLAEMSFPLETLGAAIELYDGTAAYLLDKNASSGRILYKHDADLPKDLTVAVKSGGTPGAYQFRAMLVQAEREPNNAAAAAEKIKPFTPVAAAIGSGTDTDWFAVDVPGGARLDVTAEAGFPLTVTLFDAEERRIGPGVDTAGTVYIKVKSAEISGDRSSYILRVGF